ncbi:MAG TPA: AraC family transcriptional regulator [Thermoanaerobaculia bacterium]|nr:AraC family transcriptional regulator [Thermoanaerobaculia bacterium]
MHDPATTLARGRDSCKALVVLEHPLPTAEQRRRFNALLAHFAPTPGRHDTPWPGLRCFHAIAPTVPDPVVYAPSLCIVGQGAKEASTGSETYRYDPLQYLVIGAHMPVRARIIEATPETPYLSLSLTIEITEVRDLLVELESAPASRMTMGEASAALRVSPLDTRLLDAVIRFLSAIDDPTDRRVLARPVMREILYLALRGDQGNLLRLTVEGEQKIPGVGRALNYINGHLAEPFDIATLARNAGMSSSSLHHAFKKATSLTPVQYVKRVRLDEARRLMLDEGCLAAEAAFRVGYGSPSQFSREFKRLFGVPPRAYVQQPIVATELP